MTVAELIEALKPLRGDLPVMVPHETFKWQRVELVRVVNLVDGAFGCDVARNEFEQWASYGAVVLD